MMYFSIFPEEPAVNAFFSTRQGGISPEPWGSLNFGGNTGDREERTRENRRRLAEALELSEATVVRPEQVHGSHVVCVTEEMIKPYKEEAFKRRRREEEEVEEAETTEEENRECKRKNELILPETDGVVTDCRNVLLTTIHADCLPVCFLDRVHGAVGLAHAGWKGTCQGIAKKTVELMQNEFGSEPEQLVVWIGPGIDSCCFEVGKEVYDQFDQCWPYAEEYAQEAPGNKFYLDLKGLNQRQLTEMGVREIKVSHHCTACEADLFFSHRRDQGKTGRMGAGICLLE